MTVNGLEFADYFEETIWQEPKKAPLSNEAARKLVEKLFFTNVITEAGFMYMLKELGFYS